jgi:hypothetical protein
MLLVGGTVSIYCPGGSFAVTGGVQVEAGATLVLNAGDITGDVTNAGTVSMLSFDGMADSYFTIHGAYTQASGASLVMDIDGFGNDGLAIKGLATLDGSFVLNLLNGDDPTGPNDFLMVSYGSRSGTFSSLSLPTLSMGTWDPQYDPSFHLNAFILGVDSPPPPMP